MYGNNLKGDEFNTIERMVATTPEVGVYTVTVTAKILGYGTSQDYGIAITSQGYVEEGRTFVEAITTEDIVTSDAVDACADATSLVRFQLEDWNEGESWESMSFVISENADGGSEYSCEFPPNDEELLAQFNRMHQCSACLPNDGEFSASFRLKNELDAVPVVARAVSPQCNTFLSSYQTEGAVVMAGGECNSCPVGSSLVNLLLLANVTDDDESQYSW